MTDDVTARLAEIEARANRATPGPWKTRGEGRADTDDSWVRILGNIHNDGKSSTRVATVDTFGFVDDETAQASYEGEADAEADAEFIAHARADVPWLVERLRESRKIIDEIDPNKLRILASYVVASYALTNSSSQRTEVEDDLRRWSDLLERAQQS